MIELDHVSWTGGDVTDPEILEQAPEALADMLRQCNGLLWYGGGFHLRGAVLEPAWHSLRHAWQGEDAFWRHYPDVLEGDVPFGEDCVGDQYLLRDGKVIRLMAEDGEVEPLDLGLVRFFEQAAAQPRDALSLEPLIRFDADHDRLLEPGELLRAVPPFVTTESESGNVELVALPALEVHGFHRELAARIRDVPEGGTFEL